MMPAIGRLPVRAQAIRNKCTYEYHAGRSAELIMIADWKRMTSCTSLAGISKPSIGQFQSRRLRQSFFELSAYAACGAILNGQRGQDEATIYWQWRHFAPKVFHRK